MSERWGPAHESAAIPTATVTLVEGASSAICNAGGEMAPGGAEGLFVGDTRACARLTLAV